MVRSSDDMARADEQVRAGGLILPGGKVDADAILRALEEAGEGDDEALRTVTFDIRRDLSTRLDKYLTSRITFMSRNQLQRLIDNGGVTVNARAAKSSTKIGLGDSITVVVPPPPAKGTHSEDIPLDILFEDEHLIVINKRADIITHPARGHQSGTLINALAFHFRNRSPHGGTLSGVGEEFARPGVVHRLDRDTTGCMVFAKSDEVHWKLGHQFEHRKVDKRYLAIVQGRVEPASDVIDLPLGPHPSREKGFRERQVVRHDEHGKKALTILRVLAWFGVQDVPVKSAARGWSGEAGSGSGATTKTPEYSLVELELKTGRTHQIRVHLSHLGWPIVGDDMYGGRAFEYADGSPDLARQSLHAALLEFTHPILGTTLTFQASLPPDLTRLVHHLSTNLGELHPFPRVRGTRIEMTASLGFDSAPPGKI